LLCVCCIPSGGRRTFADPLPLCWVLVLRIQLPAMPEGRQLSFLFTVGETEAQDGQVAQGHNTVSGGS
jgi:hypothetical protein